MKKHSNLFRKYVSLIEDEALPALQMGYGTTIAFLEAIPARMADYCYAAGKWSIKQVLIHMTDAERIYAYCALCIARGETHPLHHFDEKKFADYSHPDERGWEQVIRDFKVTRLSSIELFRGFTGSVLQQPGVANGVKVTPAFLGKMIEGHNQHHIEVLKQYYL